MRYTTILAMLLVFGCATKSVSDGPITTIPGNLFYESHGVTVVGTEAVLYDDLYSYAKYSVSWEAEWPELTGIHVVVNNVDAECYGAYHNGTTWVWSGPYAQEFDLPPCNYWVVACNKEETATVVESVMEF